MMKRIGRFEVSHFFMINQQHEFEPVTKLLGEIKEIDRKTDWQTERDMITAEFSEFDEIEETEEPPLYTFLFHQHADGTVTRDKAERLT